MTKKMFLMSFAVLALLATASMVMAQPGGGQGGRGPGGQGGRGQGGPGGGPGMMMGMGPGGGAMGILMNEEARTSLGMTDEQVQKLRDAGEAMRRNFQPPQRGQQGPPDAAQMAQFRERMQKMQEENRKSIESILSPDQVTKLDVMVFQRSGGINGMMVNVETLRALNLTEDQKKKIQEAQEKSMTAVRPPEGFDFRNASQEERQAQIEKMRAAGEKAREEFQATLKGILTDDQKAKAEELMKDVPEYLQRRGGPGQGGPGGPGGRQGGNLDNWRPGQGGGQNPNPNREQGRQRGNAGGRQFPG